MKAGAYPNNPLSGRPLFSDPVFQLHPGKGARLARVGRQNLIRAVPREPGWLHPWTVTPLFEPKDAAALKPGEADSEWRAYIEPGFVNGREAFIKMPPAWPPGRKQAPGEEPRDVALTDEQPPYLVIDGFRNPLSAGGIVEKENGDFVVAAGEGYPKFFETLGVKRPARGGDLLDATSFDSPQDDQRTRQIRACDIVLTHPRMGSHVDFQQVQVPLTQPAELIGSPVFDSSFALATGGRSRLRATAHFQTSPVDSLDALFLTLTGTQTPQFDELKIATIWFISPPEALDDAIPDGTWEAYVQHSVFWNLNHATKVAPPTEAADPVHFFLPLAGGAGQLAIDLSLFVVNELISELTSLLNAADTNGYFWSI